MTNSQLLLPTDVGFGRRVAWEFENSVFDNKLQNTTDMYIQAQRERERERQGTQSENKQNSVQNKGKKPKTNLIFFAASNRLTACKRQRPHPYIISFFPRAVIGFPIDLLTE